jgi:hypothetical protein
MSQGFSVETASGEAGAWARPDRAREYRVERFTPEADAAMTFARDVAFAFGQRYLAPVHLLFALCRDQAVSAGILDRLGVSRALAWHEAEERAPRGTPVSDWIVDLSPGMERIIDHAHAEAAGGLPLTTRELLIGLLREDEGLACEILREQGVTRDAVRYEDPSRMRVPSHPLEEASWPPAPDAGHSESQAATRTPMAMGYAKASLFFLILGFAASLVGPTGIFLLFSMTAAFLAFKALVEGARVEGGTLLIVTAAHILFTAAVRLLMGF